MREHDIQRGSLIWIAVGFEGGLFVLAAGAAWFFELDLPNQFHWNWGHALWAVAATLPLVAALLCIQHLRWAPLRRLRDVVDERIVPMFRDCTLLDFALISLLAGVGEEALFRGVIQTPLADKFGVALGVAAAGLLFGLAHWITTAYAVFAAIIGVYLGWLLIYFDNLLVPTIVHSLYDFVALVYLTRSPRTEELVEKRHANGKADEPANRASDSSR